MAPSVSLPTALGSKITPNAVTDNNGDLVATTINSLERSTQSGIPICRLLRVVAMASTSLQREKMILSVPKGKPQRVSLEASHSGTVRCCEFKKHLRSDWFKDITRPKTPTMRKMPLGPIHMLVDRSSLELAIRLLYAHDRWRLQGAPPGKEGQRLV
ncbi:hypothetical protein BC940DRAFT_367490 [Gongronella butleri]|nr:hypothetical protein BC940DRAFT_367490 [Gongronella butleri]